MLKVLVGGSTLYHPHLGGLTATPKTPSWTFANTLFMSNQPKFHIYITVTIFLTSPNNVNIWKSVKIQSLIIANIASLIVWIILSQDLPICDEEGGLNNNWIFWWAILLSTLLWSNFDVSISSSLTAPLKFVPQSETISDGCTLQLMNLCNALMKLSVSNDSANSICTARTDIQTKM